MIALDEAPLTQCLQCIWRGKGIISQRYGATQRDLSSGGSGNGNSYSNHSALPNRDLFGARNRMSLADVMGGVLLPPSSEAPSAHSLVGDGLHTAYGGGGGDAACINGVPLMLRLPPTVVFEHNFPKGLYFADPNTMRLTRRIGRDVDSTMCFEALMNAEETFGWGNSPVRGGGTKRLSSDAAGNDAEGSEVSGTGQTPKERSKGARAANDKDTEQRVYGQVSRNLLKQAAAQEHKVPGKHAHAKGGEGDIVAMFIEMDTEESEADVSFRRGEDSSPHAFTNHVPFVVRRDNSVDKRPIVKTHYFTEAGLRLFLLSSTGAGARGSVADASRSDPQMIDAFTTNNKHGVLQRFIYPIGKHNELIQVLWTPQMFFAEKCQSKAILGDLTLTPFQRAATFEAPANYTIKAYASPAIYEQLRESSDSLVGHLSAIERKQVANAVLYFKVDEHGALWFLFITQITFAQPLIEGPERSAAISNLLRVREVEGKAFSSSHSTNHGFLGESHSSLNTTQRSDPSLPSVPYHYGSLLSSSPLGTSPSKNNYQFVGVKPKEPRLKKQDDVTGLIPIFTLPPSADPSRFHTPIIVRDLPPVEARHRQTTNTNTKAGVMLSSGAAPPVMSITKPTNVHNSGEGSSSPAGVTAQHTSRRQQAVPVEMLHPAPQYRMIKGGLFTSMGEDELLKFGRDLKVDFCGSGVDLSSNTVCPLAAGHSVRSAEAANQSQYMSKVTKGTERGNKDSDSASPTLAQQFANSYSHLSKPPHQRELDHKKSRAASPGPLRTSGGLSVGRQRQRPATSFTRVTTNSGENLMLPKPLPQRSILTDYYYSDNTNPFLAPLIASGSLARGGGGSVELSGSRLMKKPMGHSSYVSVYDRNHSSSPKKETLHAKSNNSIHDHDESRTTDAKANVDQHLRSVLKHSKIPSSSPSSAQKHKHEMTSASPLEKELNERVAAKQHQRSQIVGEGVTEELVFSASSRLHSRGRGEKPHRNKGGMNRSTRARDHIPHLQVEAEEKDALSLPSRSMRDLEASLLEIREEEGKGSLILPPSGQKKRVHSACDESRTARIASYCDQNEWCHDGRQTDNERSATDHIQEAALVDRVAIESRAGKRALLRMVRERADIRDGHIESDNGIYQSNTNVPTLTVTSATKSSAATSLGIELLRVFPEEVTLILSSSCSAEGALLLEQCSEPLLLTALSSQHSSRLRLLEKAISSSSKEVMRLRAAADSAVVRDGAANDDVTLSLTFAGARLASLVQQKFAVRRSAVGCVAFLLDLVARCHAFAVGSPTSSHPKDGQQQQHFLFSTPSHPIRGYLSREARLERARLEELWLHELLTTTENNNNNHTNNTNMINSNDGGRSPRDTRLLSSSPTMAKRCSVQNPLLTLCSRFSGDNRSHNNNTNMLGLRCADAIRKVIRASSSHTAKSHDIVDEFTSLSLSGWGIGAPSISSGPCDVLVAVEERQLSRTQNPSAHPSSSDDLAMCRAYDDMVSDPVVLRALKEFLDRCCRLSHQRGSSVSASRGDQGGAAQEQMVSSHEQQQSDLTYCVPLDRMMIHASSVQASFVGSGAITLASGSGLGSTDSTSYYIMWKEAPFLLPNSEEEEALSSNAIKRVRTPWIHNFSVTNPLSLAYTIQSHLSAFITVDLRRAVDVADAVAEERAFGTRTLNDECAWLDANGDVHFASTEVYCPPPTPLRPLSSSPHTSNNEDTRQDNTTMAEQSSACAFGDSASVVKEGSAGEGEEGHALDEERPADEMGAGHDVENIMEKEEGHRTCGVPPQLSPLPDEERDEARDHDTIGETHHAAFVAEEGNDGEETFVHNPPHHHQHHCGGVGRSSISIADLIVAKEIAEEATERAAVAAAEAAPLTPPPQAIAREAVMLATRAAEESAMLRQTVDDDDDDEGHSQKAERKRSDGNLYYAYKHTTGETTCIVSSMDADGSPNAADFEPSALL